MSSDELQEDEVEEVYSEWKDSVNMTASELREWSKHPCSREASVDPVAVIKRNLRLLETPKSEWGSDEVEDAERTISFIARMKPNKPDEPKEGPKGCPSEWAISLLNWAFNPFDDLPDVPDDLDPVDEVTLSDLDVDKFINNPLLVGNLSDSDLESLHDAVHKRFEEKKEEMISLEDVWNLHKIIVDEMEKRGLDHDSPLPELNKEVLEKSEGLEDQVLVHNFVSLVGSSVNPDKEPNDIDVVMRAADPEELYDFLRRSVYAAISKQFKEQGVDKPVEVISESLGPHSDHKPLYDLALVNNETGEVVTNSDVRHLVDFPFEPQKPSGEFKNDAEALVESLDQEDAHWFVEKKAAGFHVIVRKNGDDVTVYTEDQTEMKGLSSFLDEVRKLEGDFIIDGELLWGESQLAGRRKLVDFVEDGDKDDSKINMSVWDIVQSDGKDITKSPLSERREKLKEVNFGETDRIDLVSFSEASYPSDVAGFIDKMSSKEGSEGAVVKEVDSKYKPGSENDSWLKFRKTQPVYVRVIERNENEGGSCNYQYGVDIPEKATELVDEAFKTKVEGKLVMSGGNTFNTEECSAEPGDIIKIRVEEVWRHLLPEGTIRYSFHKPEFVEITDREETSTLTDLDDIVTNLGVEVDERAGENFSMAKKDAAGDEGGGGVQNPEGEEGGTRTEAQEAFWDDNWHRMWDEEGSGKFILHNHWRGLTEDQSEMDNDELLDTDNSIHGDLRWTVGNEQLAGFTIFLGEAEDQPEQGSKFLEQLEEMNDADAADKLQGTFKLPQPEEWVEVAEDEPLVQEPGEVASTEEKWSKFFEMAQGEYKLGVMNVHFVELILDPDGMEERRVTITKSPLGGEERVWLIDVPDDQKPTAESTDLVDYVEELEESDTDHEKLIWNNPNDNQDPRKIDLDDFDPEEEENVKKFKDLVNRLWSE